MSWEKEVEEIRRRVELAKGMGGADNIKRQHDGGKLTVRERIERLLDAGTFHEYGALAGAPKYEGETLASIMPANFVGGTGRINGRRVVVGGDDFTVRGGAADANIGNKRSYAELIAHELHIPIIRLVDGTGGGGSVKTFETVKRTYVPANPDFDVLVKLMGEVPVVAGCMGSVAGIGAARVAASHFSVMVRGTSQLFVAGPPVVKWGVGEDLTKEELGGAEIHAHMSGSVDNEAESEDDALAQIRRFLSYLPQSVWNVPPRATPDDDPGRREEELISIVPRNRRHGYDARRIVELVMDRDSFFEMTPYFGPSLVTGFARLDGFPGRRDGERSVFDRRFAGRAGVGQDGQVRRPLRHVSSAGSELRRSARISDWARGRDGGDDSARRACAVCDVPDDYAAGCDHGAQGVRRRGRGAWNHDRIESSLRVAVGGLGIAADRGRNRGGVQARSGGVERSGKIAQGARGQIQRRALADPHRGGVRHRGNNRSARHAADARRLGASGVRDSSDAVGNSYAHDAPVGQGVDRISPRLRDSLPVLRAHVLRLRRGRA